MTVKKFRPRKRKAIEDPIVQKYREAQEMLVRCRLNALEDLVAAMDANGLNPAAPVAAVALCDARATLGGDESHDAKTLLLTLSSWCVDYADSDDLAWAVSVAKEVVL